MTIDNSPYRRKLAKLVGAFAFLIFCALAMSSAYMVGGMGFGPELIFHMLKVAVPFALCLSFIAYFAGRILDTKQARVQKKKIQLKADDDGKIQSIFSEDDPGLEEVND